MQAMQDVGYQMTNTQALNQHPIAVRRLNEKNGDMSVRYERPHKSVYIVEVNTSKH